MTTTLPHIDVLFVGLGHAGGAIANELTKRASHLKIVALERGPYRATYPDFIEDHFDEWRYNVQSGLMQDLSRNTVTFRNDAAMTALPMRQYGAFMPGNGVGGAAVHWNGVSWRYLPYFFEYRSHLEARYGKSFLPKDTTIQDWGITYDELEPYYTQYEQMYGIAGKAGNINGTIQPGGNPFEGWRSSDYPQAPVKIAYGGTLFADACETVGFSPFPQPSANSPTRYTNPDGMVLGACNYCGFCERVGCHAGAKASPMVTTIPHALKSGQLEIRQLSTVTRILHDGTKATGVRYYDGAGQEVEQTADLVILSAWTLENTRLLLLSEIGTPYDPETGKGNVGKNYTYQTGAVVGGATASVWWEDKILNRFMGSGSNGYSIDEFNSDNFDHADLDFFGGGNIACNNSGARPIQMLQLPPDTPRWGSEWKQAAQKWYNRSIFFTMQGESPAYRQNYMDLDPTYKDIFGNPLLRITFNWTDNERNMVKWVADTVLQPIADAMNGNKQKVSGVLTDFNISPYQSTHVQGGAIMGASPESSVVNKYGQVWGMPNLFVVGASSFPQNGGYNPTGTVGALAYHTADALITKYLPSPGMLA